MLVSHFRFRAPRRSHRSGSAGTAPVGTLPPDHPLSDLLTRLRGQQITVFEGGRFVAGRLLSLDPVTLVGPAGEAVVLLPEQIQSVEF